MSYIHTTAVFIVSVFVLLQPKPSSAGSPPFYHISILLDVSSSMRIATSTLDEHRMNLAIDVVASRLTHDLALYDTYQLDVYTWSDNLHAPPVFSDTIVSEEDAFMAERTLQQHSYAIGGLTPTGRALKQFVDIHTDSTKICSRHTLLLVTDDPPQDSVVFEEHLARAQEAGFSVGVLLIDSSTVHQAMRYFTRFEDMPHAVIRRELNENALDDFLYEVLSAAELPSHCFAG